MHARNVMTLFTTKTKGDGFQFEAFAIKMMGELLPAGYNAHISDDFSSVMLLKVRVILLD